MARIAANRNLQEARANKKDEFYTQLSDIERELKHYTKHFKNKIYLKIALCQNFLSIFIIVTSTITKHLLKSRADNTPKCK